MSQGELREVQGLALVFVRDMTSRGQSSPDLVPSRVLGRTESSWWGGSKKTLPGGVGLALQKMERL